MINECFYLQRKQPKAMFAMQGINKSEWSVFLKVRSDEAENAGVIRGRKRLHGARNQGKGYYVA